MCAFGPVHIVLDVLPIFSRMPMSKEVSLKLKKMSGGSGVDPGGGS